MASVVEKERLQCESWRDKLLRATSGRPYKMLMEMAKRGCFVNLDTFFECSPCDQKVDGGFVVSDQATKKVILCQNQLKSESELENTMTHELVHVYDYCRAKIDFSNCQHHACTEIRAANISDDCNIGYELARGNVNVWNHREKCIKRRAALSLSENPHCAGKGAEAVEAVFARCVRDLTPLEL